MKPIFLRLLLIAAFLPPSLCRSQLVFFKGTIKSDIAGGQNEVRQTWRTIVVFEPSSGNLVKLNYLSASGGLKVFTDEQIGGFVSTQVTFARGRTNTVLAAAQSSTDTNSQVSATACFLRGANTRLNLTRTNTLLFPKLLNWSYNGLGASSATGSMTSWLETGVLSFDAASTLTANSQNEALIDAETRLRGYLQTLGYREVVIK